MALQIINAPGADLDETAAEMKRRIEAAIDDAEVEVQGQGPGHFEIRVKSSAFEGLSRVKQQQLVYAPIAEMMSGPDAAVHAIDKMECEVR